MGLADDRARTERVAVAPTGRSARVSRAVSDLLQFAVASGAAAAIAYGIWTRLPEELDVRTDIVGYPIHSNFNMNRYFWLYWLIAGFVPLVTLVVFLVLRKVIPRSAVQRAPRARRPAVEAPLVPASHTDVVTVGIARVLFVGGILGLETACALSRASGWFLSVGVPVMAGYALLASLAALALGRTVHMRDTPFWERLALANALAVPFCIGALYAVSRSTEVTVTASGRVHEYSWLPLWLAAGLTALALVWVIRGAIRAHAAAELRALERRLLLIVAGPVALLLFVALLPGSRSGIDFFHEGELLAGARLVEEGAFPWRDVIFIHGLLTDAAFQSLGFNVFEHSRWGYLAGTLVVVIPLYWISFYCLAAYLFHRNWLFLVGTQLAVILAVVVEGHLRFILLPLVFVLMGALLSNPSRIRGALFMSVLVTQTIVTPEAGIAAVAVLLTIVAFEAYYYDRSKAFTENFQRTLSCAAAGALLTAAWAVFLLAFGALDDFVLTSVAFASDHQLTGATPVNWASDRYRFAAVAPVVLVVLAFWYFAVQILRRGRLRISDWVMGAAALFVALYYHKFLARSDHVFQPYAVAIPLLSYVLYRLIEAGEDGLSRLRRRFNVRLPMRYPLTAVAVLVLLVEAPLTIPDVVRDAPSRLDATASEEARTRQVGFIEAPERYDEILGDVDSVLRRYLGPDDELFDFTNSPALFHYLLERRPATRYYHVSMAIRKGAQEDLVEELERARPKLVVFSSGTIGLPEWDGISNQVRHYLVSRYLLDYYRPLHVQEGFVFMGRRDAASTPAPASGPRTRDTRDLYFRTYPCNWGYAPNFLTPGPSASSSAQPLSVAARNLGPVLSVSGWAVDPDAQGPAAKVVAAINERVVAEVVPSAHRPDIAAHQGDAAYLASGFTVELRDGPVPGGGVQAVRIYGLSRSGKATELRYPGGSALGAGPPGPRQLRLGQRRVPVVAGAVEGFADSSSLLTQVVALDMPRGVRRSAYSWLEIESRSPLKANGFMLTDGATGGDRGIAFRTLARDETTVRVMVGACSQWHGYSSRRLYLRLDRRETIAAVRLYR